MSKKRFGIVRTPKAPETEPLSDKSQLVWAGVKQAGDQAAAAVNKAIETLSEVTARYMAQLDGKDVKEWQFHVGTGQWVRKGGQ